MNELELEIISPEKRVFKGKVKSITVPGTKGNFQILYNHAPLISTFEIGIIKFELENNSAKVFTTSGGSVEVLNNQVLILSDTIESVEKIDLERAKNSKARAEERLSLRNADIDLDRARISLARALNRIKAVDKFSSD